MITHTASSAQRINLNFVPIPTASTPPTGVDVWLLKLSPLTNKPLAEFAVLVSDAEFIRARQLKHNSTHFLITRTLLRAVLSRYTKLSAQDLLFGQGQHGKPFLANAPATIHFNLSHCEDIAVLAVSAKCEVGVDIEIANTRDYLKIAKRYFHKAELQALQTCAPSERDILFYKLWTLKEAFCKATGGGVSSGLDKISFQLTENSISASIDSTLNTHVNEWQFHQEMIADNTLVALALHSQESIKPQWLDGNAFLNRV